MLFTTQRFEQPSIIQCTRCASVPVSAWVKVIQPSRSNVYYCQLKRFFFLFPLTASTMSSCRSSSPHCQAHSSVFLTTILTTTRLRNRFSTCTMVNAILFHSLSTVVWVVLVWYSLSLSAVNSVAMTVLQMSPRILAVTFTVHGPVVVQNRHF